MLKKFFTSALILIVLTVVCMVPVSAAELDDALVYDLEFAEGGEVSDAAGTANVFELREGDLSVFYDDEIGMNVAEIGPDVQYAVKGANIQEFKNLTIEAYLKITNDSPDDITLFNVTNSGVTVMIKENSAVIGTGKGGEFEIDPLERNVWIHLVLSLGESEQVVYVNGVEAGRAAYEANFVGSSSTTYLGRWNEDSGMDLAIFRVYEAAATAEDATAMYQTVSESTSESANPSATEASDVTPVPSATDKPTTTTAPTTAPTSEPAAESGLSGTTIAVIVAAVIVVIAAVVVIIIVVSKKKKAK